MAAPLDARLRRVVADSLGVTADELTPAVSLVDDLAADSLDVLELVLAVEAELGVVIPEREVTELRSYGDLLDLVQALSMPRAEPPREPATVRARVIPGAGPARALERAATLTPYVAQTIAEDALRAGPGARLEVELAPTASDQDLTAVRDRFAGLGARGVHVTVRRQLPARFAPPVPPAQAAGA